MTQKKTPQCGDWLKLVECLALKRHDEYGEEINQGDFFRFLGLSAAEGYCECYSPRLKSRFWIKLEYLIPIKDTGMISVLEVNVPAEFKQASFTSSPHQNKSLESDWEQQGFNTGIKNALQQRTKEN